MFAPSICSLIAEAWHITTHFPVHPTRSRARQWWDVNCGKKCHRKNDKYRNGWQMGLVRCCCCDWQSFLVFYFQFVRDDVSSWVCLCCQQTDLIFVNSNWSSLVVQLKWFLIRDLTNDIHSVEFWKNFLALFLSRKHSFWKEVVALAEAPLLPKRILTFVEWSNKTRYKNCCSHTFLPHKRTEH